MIPAAFLSLLAATASALLAPADSSLTSFKNTTSPSSESEPILAPLNVTIHDSCTPQQVHQLVAAFEDTEQLVSVAQQHLLKHGRNSTAYQRYFGDSPSAEALGVYTRILGGSKEGVLVRCDDADGNWYVLPIPGP